MLLTRQSGAAVSSRPRLLTLLFLPRMQFQMPSQERAGNQILINDNSVPIMPLGWSAAGTCKKSWGFMFKPRLVLFSYIFLSVKKLLYSSHFPTSRSGAAVGPPQSWVGDSSTPRLLGGKVCVALLIATLMGRTVIYALFPVSLGTSCTSTRPSSLSIRAPAAELTAVKWEHPCPKSRSLPPAIPGSLTGQRRPGQEHIKWWRWNWDCSEVLTGSSPGLTFWKLHSVTALCPRISLQHSQCTELCLHSLGLPWQNTTDWLTRKQKLIPLGSEVNIKSAGQFDSLKGFSYQSSDGWLFGGNRGKSCLIMETPQSWSHLCSIKRLPQNHHTGDRAQHGIRREGTQRFIQLFMVALCIYFFEQNIRFKHLNLGSNVGLNLTITQASV